MPSLLREYTDSLIVHVAYNLVRIIAVHNICNQVCMSYNFNCHKNNNQSILMNRKCYKTCMVIFSRSLLYIPQCSYIYSNKINALLVVHSGSVRILSPKACPCGRLSHLLLGCLLKILDTEPQTQTERVLILLLEISYCSHFMA